MSDASAAARWRTRSIGLLVAGAIAIVAIWLSGMPAVQARGISALTFAIVIGMVTGNTIYPRIAESAGPGIAFARQTLLRSGVVLYGFRLTVQDIGHVGVAGVIIDGLMVTLTFLIATWVGTRLLKMDRKTAMLIGAGSAICGAAAVMAAEPVVRGRAEQVSVAVAGVVVFGTIAMFLYPVLYLLNGHWHVIPGNAQTFGVYIGSTVHEVAQVVAAGRQVGADAVGTAVIAKMVRVLMLAPFLVVLAGWIGRNTRDAEEGSGHPASGAAAAKRPPAVPAFAFVFIGVVLFNSLGLIPKPAIDLITLIDTGLLAAAMAALGISTHVKALRQTGTQPFVLALILFVWLVIGGALINRGVAFAIGG
jgi:uncharacterized integral membrane protein (TIGR00698 family)